MRWLMGGRRQGRAVPRPATRTKCWCCCACCRLLHCSPETVVEAARARTASRNARCIILISEGGDRGVSGRGGRGGRTVWCLDGPCELCATMGARGFSCKHRVSSTGAATAPGPRAKIFTSGGPPPVEICTCCRHGGNVLAGRPEGRLLGGECIAPKVGADGQTPIVARERCCSSQAGCHTAPQLRGLRFVTQHAPAEVGSQLQGCTQPCLLRTASPAGLDCRCTSQPSCCPARRSRRPASIRRQQRKRGVHEEARVRHQRLHALQCWR